MNIAQFTCRKIFSGLFPGSQKRQRAARRQLCNQIPIGSGRNASFWNAPPAVIVGA